MSAPATAQVAVPRWPFLDLTKPRLNLLVLLTTLAGYYLGSTDGLRLLPVLWMLLGTGLVASGAAALNQWMERELDSRMRRTRDRPLPSGRLQPGEAAMFGVVLTVGGLAVLGIAVNLLTAGLGALTTLTYLALYTPLKTITPFNTLAGAAPGAIPPVIGWAAARGRLDLEAIVLFGILFLWQMPHFLAIAWLYRDDYENAGFRMLPSVAGGAKHTGIAASAHAALLIPISALPALLGLAGGVYLIGAVLLGLSYLTMALRMAARPGDATARGLFRASLLYLPALFLLMSFDKVAA